MSSSLKPVVAGRRGLRSSYSERGTAALWVSGRRTVTVGALRARVIRIMVDMSKVSARARKLLTVLGDPVYRRALAHGVAASVEHEAIPLRGDFRTVIDAGANRGQFALFATRRFPDAALICFEPLPGPGARLLRVIGGSARLSLRPVALGAADGDADFHVSAADDSSSLLPIGRRQREAFPGTDERSTSTVKVRRLDEMVSSEELVSPVLLKIDVQGGELGVLQGAEGVLVAVDAVLVEVSFVELYDGQPLADDVWSFLRPHGFSSRGVWSLSYGRTGECLQGDLLFARDGFQPLHE
jgi:FkbM family methyltransferase